MSALPPQYVPSSKCAGTLFPGTAVIPLRVHITNTGNRAITPALGLGNGLGTVIDDRWTGGCPRGPWTPYTSDLVHVAKLAPGRSIDIPALLTYDASATGPDAIVIAVDGQTGGVLTKDDIPFRGYSLRARTAAPVAYYDGGGFMPATATTATCAALDLADGNQCGKSARDVDWDAGTRLPS
jgi:hypothetical protein